MQREVYKNQGKLMKIATLGMVSTAMILLGIFFLELTNLKRTELKWSIDQENPNKVDMPDKWRLEQEMHLDAMKALSIALCVFGGLGLLFKFIVGWYYRSSNGMNRQTNYLNLS